MPHRTEVNVETGEVKIIELTPEEIAQDEANAAAQAAIVPQAVTARQALLELNATGMLDTIEAAIAQAPRATRIEWERAQEFRRDWPLLVQMAAQLGITDAQLDALFKGAAVR